MRRMIALLIALCLCVGGLVYAHAAVSVQEEQLSVYPISEFGDPAVLAGRTLSVDITCSDHLTWATAHTFGLGTKTEFTFTPNPPKDTAADRYSRLDIWLSRGVSMSTSGSVSPQATPGYGEMVNTVAALTPNGGSQTMKLKLADYVDHYSPEFDISFRNDAYFCDERMDLTAQITGDYDWVSSPEVFTRFTGHFRFPVQEDTIVSITVHKNELGEIVGLDYTPVNQPELNLIGTATDEGLIFLPVFQKDGQPLEADLPDGTGIYFVPWKETGNTLHYNTVLRKEVTPDWENAENRYPVDAALSVVDMKLSGSDAWLLTREDGQYVLRVLDLAAGQEKIRLEVLEIPDEAEKQYISWDHTDRWMTVTTKQQLSLIDLTDYSIALTAPLGDLGEHLYYYWSTDYGLIDFDGETLILADTVYWDQGLFWIGAFRADGIAYYGEYDCSILRGNDNWYFNEITGKYSQLHLD